MLSDELLGHKEPSQSTGQGRQSQSKEFQSSGGEDALTWPSQASANECCMFSSNDHFLELQLGTSVNLCVQAVVPCLRRASETHSYHSLLDRIE